MIPDEERPAGEVDKSGELFARSMSRSPRGRASSLGGWLLAILLIYSIGLTQDLTEPWVGMHDWNGAFFSQLARNFLRYPIAVDHGMPLVAMGQDVPSTDERSIYATHPPGLVWMLASAFAVLGESEAVARIVPILASIASLGLLVWIIFLAYGLAEAILAGLIYSVMPMSVYFGRMVDHEPICLLFMLAAVAAWAISFDESSSRRMRGRLAAGWLAAIVLGIWIDWSGVLFSGVFFIYIIYQLRERRLYGRRMAMGGGAIVMTVIGMTGYLVYAGLDGRWADLWAIFISRTTEVSGQIVRKDAASAGGLWTYAVENLSLPVLILAGGGMVLELVSLFRGKLDRKRASFSSVSSQDVEDGKPPEEKSLMRQAAQAGLWILLITGGLWLVIFHRQFIRHNYWMFYVGPAAALFSARGLLSLWRQLSIFRISYSVIGVGVLVICTLAAEVIQTRDYFGRHSYPTDAPAALRRIHDAAPAGRRIILFDNPIRIEQRGGYRFRNIIPPILAYYLDRPFDVERDFARVGQLASTHALFVLPMKDAIGYGEALRPLRKQFREWPAGEWVVFDLRRPNRKSTQGPAH